MAYTKFQATEPGVNVIVPAPGVGNRIDVFGIFMQCASGTTVKIRSGESSAIDSTGDMTGHMQFVTGGGLNLAPVVVVDTMIPLFQCTENEALSLFLDGTNHGAAGAIMYSVATV